ncbi:DNA repair protein XRCC1 [Orussus abietinus]|uniref:DNA repair protein XRCC1 n=1 Tax=Orussus abietinus TaxID=222816 RepID=UPI000626C75F|nr:DNA repair protein XRCC1 [Orussus abietinus]
MIIKLEKVISYSSEHSSYPASNLLEYRPNSSWRCAKPGELLATVIFQLAEPSRITGLDIGNYRSCIVVVDASTSADPDNWLPIVNHQFLTHDEAARGNFRDQVQLFTKKELNPTTLQMKFDRVKVTCMQSANRKELFGLLFIILRTEVSVDLGLDVFGRFKVKDDNTSSNVDEFKQKYFKQFEAKHSNYKDELLAKIKETGEKNFIKRQEEGRTPAKRPLLEKLEAGKADEVFGKPKNIFDEPKKKLSLSEAILGSDAKNTINTTPVQRTPFGDILPSSKVKPTISTQKNGNDASNVNLNKRLSPQNGDNEAEAIQKKLKCSLCQKDSPDCLCQNCNRLPPQKPVQSSPKKVVKRKPMKHKKAFDKLFEGISFALSGYVNPQRDKIRKKALKMGAKYIANPDTRNNKCTHLICAFKNTPKSQQLKGFAKMVTHKFIEDCFDKKKRFPWRRYALNKEDQTGRESEEEIEATTSPARSPNPYEQDTDESDN